MNRKELKEKAKAVLKSDYWYLFFVTTLATLLIAASSFVSWLVAGPILVGLNIALFNKMNGMKDDLIYIFKSFSTNFIEAFKAFIKKTVYVFLWSLLFIIPGIVKSISYSMTDFIMAEDENIKSTAAIEKSMEMMEGHKMEYFVLMLSFIGWYILGILTFGIGLFFLMPYVRVTQAQFYLSLKNEIEVVEKDEEIEVINL